ncbi:hypothetical protein A2J03_28525 [Rhodococcus sp. EPR-157]|nr:hypothetical protein A2J03_28525 [Rhodococcus sp. EPR-157]
MQSNTGTEDERQHTAARRPGLSEDDHAEVSAGPAAVIRVGFASRSCPKVDGTRSGRRSPRVYGVRAVSGSPNVMARARRNWWPASLPN